MDIIETIAECYDAIIDGTVELYSYTWEGLQSASQELAEDMSQLAPLTVRLADEAYGGLLVLAGQTYSEATHMWTAHYIRKQFNSIVRARRGSNNGAPGTWTGNPWNLGPHSDKSVRLPFDGGHGGQSGGGGASGTWTEDNPTLTPDSDAPMMPVDTIGPVTRFYVPDPRTIVIFPSHALDGCWQPSCPLAGFIDEASLAAGEKWEMIKAWFLANPGLGCVGNMAFYDSRHPYFDTIGQHINKYTIPIASRGNYYNWQEIGLESSAYYWWSTTRPFIDEFGNPSVEPIGMVSSIHGPPFQHPPYDNWPISDYIAFRGQSNPVVSFPASSPGAYQHEFLGNDDIFYTRWLDTGVVVTGGGYVEVQPKPKLLRGAGTPIVLGFLTKNFHITKKGQGFLTGDDFRPVADSVTGGLVAL